MGQGSVLVQCVSYVIFMKGSWLILSCSYIYGGFGFSENATVGTISA
jgi:hypothetical protein